MTKKQGRGRPPGITNETVQKVERIYQLKKQGLTLTAIAKLLGVSQGYVSNLYNHYEPA